MRTSSVVACRSALWLLFLEVERPLDPLIEWREVPGFAVLVVGLRPLGRSLDATTRTT